MAKRPKITDWLSSPRQPATTRDVLDSTTSIDYLLAAMRSTAPGQWSANLLELSRHFTSAVYLAVNTLATQASQAEAKVMEWTPDPEDGDLHLPETDPACQLLLNPNDDDSLGDLLYQITQQLELTGIALIWKPITNDLGVPSELYVIPSATALPWPASPMFPNGQYLVQPYTPYGPWAAVPMAMSAAGARIPAEQIIRIKKQHPYLRYDGYAVLSAMRTQVDTISAIDQARLSTQQKGVDPLVSLEFDPDKIDLAQADFVRMRQQLESLYSGPLGSKVWLNPFGSKMTKIGNTPADMSWCEGWSQLVDFALAMYGTPKAVAGLQDDVSYATLYSSLKQFNILTINPLLKKIADKLTKHLLVPYFGEDLYLKLEGQQITDEELREKQLQTNIQAGNAMRVNEFRKVRNLKPIPGPEGDEFIGKKTSQPMTEQLGLQTSDRPTADVANTRPTNNSGGNSLPPQVKFNRFVTQLERAKTNGTAHKI